MPESEPTTEQPAPTAIGLSRVPEPGGAGRLVWSLPASPPTQEAQAMLQRLRDAPLQGLALPETLTHKGGQTHLSMRDPGGALGGMPGDGASAGLSAEAVLSAGLQVARVLQQLHAIGLVHGRLSPDALIWDTDGRLTLALPPDALAPLAEGQDPLVGRSSAALGCLAPEQTGRTGAAVTARADLHALGALLFAWCEGCLPFAAGAPLETVHRLLATAAPPAASAPEALRRIIAKLLAKAPEDRYQTAFGVLVDLETCRAALRPDGSAPAFRLGRRDGARALAFPSHPVGRAAEVARLTAAWAETIRGRAPLVALRGRSGSGKTVLATEALAGADPAARVGSGKYDQVQGRPYSGLLDAVRGLIRHQVKAGGTSLAGLKARLSDNLDVSWGVLAELIPEIGQLVGLPQIAEAETGERVQRLRIAVRALFAALAGPGQPAVLLLDDVQWADRSSLALLQELMETADLPHLMLVLLYRDEEVRPDHALHPILRAAQGRPSGVEEIALSPLDLGAAQDLVAQALEMGRAEVAELAELLHARTEGNPFNMRETMISLCDNHVIFYDPVAERWRWDMETARARVLDADIAALIAARIDRLRASTSSTLATAACVGAQFTIDDIRLASTVAEDDCRAALGEARAAGLVRRIGDGDRYAFSHDRVQEAAYALLAAEALERMHLAIGKGLLEAAEAAGGDDRYFAAMDHLARAVAYVDDPDLARRIAAAALIAGRGAKRVAAYAPAKRFLDAALALPAAVSVRDGRSDHETRTALLAEKLEVDYLLDGWEAARPSYETLMSRLTDPRAQARIDRTMVALMDLRAEFPRAIEHGIRAMRRLGHDLRPPYGPKIAAALLRTQLGLLGRNAIDFSDLPRMSDPAREEEMETLLTISTPAFLEDKDFFVLLSLRMFSMTLRHGLTDAGIASITYQAVVRYLAFGAVEGPLRTMRNLYDHCDRFGVSDLVRGRVNHTYCMVLAWYDEPYAQIFERLEQGVEVTRRGADLEYLGHYHFGLMKYAFVMGRPLDDLARLLDGYEPMRRSLRHDTMTAMHATCARFIAVAQGAPGTPLWGPEDETLMATLKGEPSVGGFLQAWHLLAHVMGDTALAARVHAQLLPLEDFALLGPDMVDWHLCGMLTHAGALDDRTRRKAFRRHLRALQRLARRYPVNHAPHGALAEAERLRAEGGTALPRYGEAAALAEAAGLLHYAGLAAERGAELAAATGRGQEADALRRRARAAYARWGARRKVAEIDRRWPHLARTAGDGSDSDRTSMLDLATLEKAGAAIFERVDEAALPSRILAILMENAGADHGALLRVEGGAFHLAAEGRFEQGRLQAVAREDQPSIDEMTTVALPVAAARAAVETAEPVYVQSAPESFRAADGALPRSACCLPVARGGTVEAVVVLENRATAGVFTPERREVMRLLGSLAAVSLANARLYARQTESLALERRATQELQRAAQLKDEFLANTSHELRTPLHGIIGLAETLRHDVARMDGTHLDETLGMIAASGRRLSALVEDVLDVSLLERGEVSLRTGAIDLRAIADVVLTLAGPKAEESGVRLVNAVPPGLAPALADENRLQQVLLNLVDNGIKHGGHGATVEVSAAGPEGGRLTVAVEDDGPGIAPEDRDAIFESFRQADGSAQRVRGGVGLGLSIARRLTELHGGHLRLDETTSRGARFLFDLPVAEPFTEPVTEPMVPVEGRSEGGRQPAAPAVPPAAPAFAKGADGAPDTRPGQRGAAPASAPKVAPTAALTPLPAHAARRGPRRCALVVDDDPVNLRVMGATLEHDGYEVVAADSGSAALRLLTEGLEPDVVLLDVMMPRMSGYEVCREIRARAPATQLPVIMLTAKTQIDDLKAAFQTGANDYITKPFSREEVLARIRTHVELSKVNLAYERFVPVEFLRLLERDSIIDIELGDSVEREMAVMFTDMRFYSSITERLDPRTNFDFVSGYFRRIGPHVQENGGVVNTFLGDGLMALFPGGQAPQDAIRASVEMQLDLDRFNAERASRGAEPVRTGIGLHVGDLVLGILGDRYRRAGNVVSDAVNTASRIEGLTGHYGIRIAASREIIDRLPDPSELRHREIDRVRVKGRDRPVSVCEVFAADPQEEADLKAQTLDTFGEALAELRYGNFGHARVGFAEVLRANPRDTAADVLLRRCDRFARDGLPQDWEGMARI